MIHLEIISKLYEITYILVFWLLSYSNLDIIQHDTLIASALPQALPQALTFPDSFKIKITCYNFEKLVS